MRHKIVLAITAVILLAAASLAVLGQNAKPKDSLHQRAKQAGGHFVLRYRPNRSTIYPNIEELAKRSDLIVVGLTIGHRPSLRPDGNFITTDYQVRVLELIKGDLANARSIVISLPGGSHRFPDGTFAIVKPLREKDVGDRETCIFFLRSKKQNSDFNGYLLASETQGLFRLINGNVDSTDSVAGDPLVVKYQGMSAKNFLAQIHLAAPRKKK
jgi:hypothetical protein